MKYRALAATMVLLASTLPADNGLAAVFGSSQGTAKLNAAQVTDLMTVAARQGWNVFDLLDEACLYLKAKGTRVVIAGDDLRAASRKFELGGRRVDALLPLSLVESVSMGARQGTDADIEIRIAHPFSAFLELGDFSLETVYGFKDVGEKELANAFGVTVRNGILQWTLQKVARVPDPKGKGNPNFIAIHLNNFFQAKRWAIRPIRPAAPTTP